MILCQNVHDGSSIGLYGDRKLASVGPGDDASDTMVESPSRPGVGALIGHTIDDRYSVESLLGEGATGAVYLARQPDGANVAIKVLHEDLGGDEELRERFEREARALFGLEHPNILHVLDFGIIDRSPYLVMEMLEGKPLDQLIEDEPLDPVDALAIARQILEGLSYAHTQGALHRDLKCENVFVHKAKDGRKTAKLLDFGLVKFVDDDRWGASKQLTMQGVVMGTPAYMAPEQCSGEPTSAATDVYSAGVILFELLTGQWPFMEESRIAMSRAHMMTPPPTLKATRPELDIHPALEELVARALAKTPGDRFSDAAAMLKALDAIPAPAARLAGGSVGAGAFAASPASSPTAASTGGSKAPSTGGSKAPLFLGIGVAIVLAAVAAFVLGK